MQLSTNTNYLFQRSIFPPVARVSSKAQQTQQSTRPTEYTEPVELQLSQGATTHQVVMGSGNEVVGRLQAASQSLQEEIERLRTWNTEEPQDILSQATSIMGVANFLEGILQRLEKEAEGKNRVASVLNEEVKNEILTECEKLKLYFKEDDLTSREGIEAFLKKAETLNGNLGVFSNDLSARVWKLFHESDPREKWGLGPQKGGTLKSSIEARRAAVKVSSTVGRGLDLLLGLDGSQQKNRVVKLLAA